MRFKHDIYDIDVYSLCESVYYSCNNDEYDYVLECINNWIYNNYNDNILLEDVLNEISEEDYEKRMMDFFYNKIVPHAEDQRKTWASYKRKIPTFYDDMNFYAPDFRKPTSELTKQEKEVRAFVRRFHAQRSRLRAHNVRQLLKRYIANPTDKKNLENMNVMFRQYDEESQNAFYNNPQETMDKFYSKDRIYSTDKEQRDFFRYIFAERPDIIAHLKSSRDNYKTLYSDIPSLSDDMKQIDFGDPPNKDPLFPSPLGNNIEKSVTPSKIEQDIKNPSQQETQPNTPPKQDKPVVTSNGNNQSRLSRATTWMKNNKGKTALGVGLGAAAIGGSIYAYKRFKNRPRSVIAKRIQALRGIYHKFMINAQRNPRKLIYLNV